MNGMLNRLALVIVILGAATFGRAQTAPSYPQIGAGKVVGLDYFFNHQVKNGEQFHYIWDDTKASGYSKFGDVWKQYGATLASLKTEPTGKDLAQYSIFIIVNPSTVKNAADHQPNFMTQADADVIAQWVNDGGILCLFANDVNNCEFEHFNLLPEKFGIKYNADLRNTVPTHMDMARGTFADLPDVPLFKGVRGMYVKEISTITVSDPAQPLLTAPKQDGASGTDIIIATAHYGKGFVFAVGDPWFYNEYIDAKAPAELNLPLDNRLAANNFCQWILGTAGAPMRNP
jgi:unsaturated rhamnogalacturonyl hydrolase